MAKLFSVINLKSFFDFPTRKRFQVLRSLILLAYPTITPLGFIPFKSDVDRSTLLVADTLFLLSTGIEAGLGPLVR
jgi:hypothetical protein